MPRCCCCTNRSEEAKEETNCECFCKYGKLITISYVCNAFFFMLIVLLQISGCLSAPQGFSPSLTWQQQQVSKFSEVRQVLDLN